MGYKRPFEEAMDSLDKDIDVIEYELQQILDLDDIDDIKVAISDVLQTVREMK